MFMSTSYYSLVHVESFQNSKTNCFEPIHLRFRSMFILQYILENTINKAALFLKKSHL